MILVLFDGECHICDTFVQFLLNKDGSNQFLFSSQQSEAGMFIREQYAIPAETDSVIVLDGAFIYTKSDAALHVLSKLGFPWRILCLFRILPRNIRDMFYDYIAENRYKWFGQKQKCRIPTCEERKKFITAVHDLPCSMEKINFKKW